MELDILKMYATDTKDLEEYIRQIKSYESQLEIVNKSIEEEEELKKKRPKWTLVLWTGIAGLRYHVDSNTDEGKEMLKKLVPGLELKLVREPENKYDRWAVAVYTKEDFMLGYITRYKNETIARLMDEGYTFHIFVEDHQQTNFNVPDTQRAYTENYTVPCSIWME